MPMTVKTSRRTTMRLAAIAAAATLSAGCSTLYAPPHPLDGTSWRLANVETSGTSTQLTTELSSRHRLTFEAGGRLQMQLDCNRGNADWSASMPVDDNGTISVGPVASTRAFCPPPTFGEELATSLPEATEFGLMPEGTRLSIRAPRAIYIFVRD